MLYDGHTSEEWDSIGYDVEIYEDEDEFPLKWNKAILYGTCLKCRCIDDLTEASVVEKQIIGICNGCSQKQ
jgi:hypothetical protein